MNRLKDEKSPYLLQHAENLMDWYAWSEEAFSKAVREDRPVFLSIGYSTCHWCHVMAHECFEDKEMAEILNREYITEFISKPDETIPDIPDKTLLKKAVHLLEQQFDPKWGGFGSALKFPVPHRRHAELSARPQFWTAGIAAFLISVEKINLCDARRTAAKSPARVPSNKLSPKFDADFEDRGKCRDAGAGVAVYKRLSHSRGRDNLLFMPEWDVWEARRGIWEAGALVGGNGIFF